MRGGYHGQEVSSGQVMHISITHTLISLS